MNFYNFICHILEHNPTLKQPDLVYLPIADMRKMFPGYDNFQEFRQFQYIAHTGIIDLKASPTNKIIIKYYKNGIKL